MATTKQEVDRQSARDRLWESLNYSYGKKRDDIQKEYNRAQSQIGNQLLSRGMQRSSYGIQTQANLGKQAIDAESDNWDAQIADYQNRLGQLDQQDAEADRWEREFAERQRQYDTNLGYQRERDAAGDAQWEKQFGEGQRQFNANLEFQAGEAEKNRAFQTGEREAQQQWQSGENAANRAFQTGEREAQQRYSTSEREASQNYQAAQEALQREWQSGENAASREENQRQFNEDLAFRREQANQQQENVNREYEANRSDTAWSQAFQQAQADRDQGNTEWQQAFQQRQADIAQANADREFAAKREDTAWSQAFQQNRANASDEQWRQNYEEGVRQYNENMAFNRERAGVADDQWQKEFDLKAGKTSSGSGGTGGKKKTPENQNGNNTPPLNDKDFIAALLGGDAASRTRAVAPNAIGTALANTSNRAKTANIDANPTDISAELAKALGLEQKKKTGSILVNGINARPDRIKSLARV